MQFAVIKSLYIPYGEVEFNECMFEGNDILPSEDIVDRLTNGENVVEFIN